MPKPDQTLTLENSHMQYVNVVLWGIRSEVAIYFKFGLFDRFLSNNMIFIVFS